MGTNRSIDGFTRRAPLERPVRVDRAQLRYRPHAMPSRPSSSSLEPVPPVMPPVGYPPVVSNAQKTVTSPPSLRPIRSAVPMQDVSRTQAAAPRMQPSARPIAAPQPAVAAKQPRRLSMKRHGLVGMAIVLFVFGLAVSLNTWHTNRTVLVQAQQQASRTVSNDAELADENAAPATDKPTDKAVQSYQVAPDLPRYIRIGKINVFSRVRQMGLTSSGAIATPSNVHDTGWYMGSAKPGEAGATVIDGHVSSWQTNGVFHDLPKLMAGDTVEVERGDGRKIQYAVVSTQTFNAEEVDMASLMVSAKPGKSGLNLITCTGKVIKGTNDFDKRFVVYAVQK